MPSTGFEAPNAVTPAGGLASPGRRWLAIRKGRVRMMWLDAFYRCAARVATPWPVILPRRIAVRLEPDVVIARRIAIGALEVPVLGVLRIPAGMAVGKADIHPVDVAELDRVDVEPRVRGLARVAGRVSQIDLLFGTDD